VKTGLLVTKKLWKNVKSQKATFQMCQFMLVIIENAICSMLTKEIFREPARRKYITGS